MMNTERHDRCSREQANGDPIPGRLTNSTGTFFEIGTVKDWEQKESIPCCLVVSCHGNYCCMQAGCNHTLDRLRPRLVVLLDVALVVVVAVVFVRFRTNVITAH